MPYTVHVVCEATQVDESVTVSEDALVLDLFAHAGVTDSLDLLTYTPVYYQYTEPISVNILQPATSVPEGETLFIHERE